MSQLGSQFHPVVWRQGNSHVWSDQEAGKTTLGHTSAELSYKSPSDVLILLQIQKKRWKSYASYTVQAERRTHKHLGMPIICWQWGVEWSIHNQTYTGIISEIKHLQLWNGCQILPQQIQILPIKYHNSVNRGNPFQNAGYCLFRAWEHGNVIHILSVVSPRQGNSPQLADQVIRWRLWLYPNLTRLHWEWR